MNDFTKEELEQIKSWADLIRKMATDVSVHRSLLKKLEIMIDNYCEHESARIDYDHQALRCNKCLEIVE